MEICDHTGMPGGTATVYAACHIVREGSAAYVCQHAAKGRKFGIRAGTACASSANCRTWCTGQGYAGCACSLGERISNGAPRRAADFPNGMCVGWTGAFTEATINSCIR